MIILDMDMPKSCDECKALCSKNMESETVFYCGLNDKSITNCADFLNAISKNCPIKCDIEDIKAEIDEIAQGHNPTHDPFDGGYTVAIMDVLNIIDKHISGDMKNDK